MTMRTISLLTLLLTTITLASGQIFEGKITYKNEFKSKIPNVPDEQLTAMMGNTLDYYIKDGNYKSTTNGTFLQWQLYINKDNKLYNKMSNSATILWNDGAVNADEVIKSELNKGVTTILGYQCDELILTCKSGVQKYYFNSKLEIDPKFYENHKFANWYHYVSQSKAVPLKIMVDNAQFSVVSMATNIQSQKIDAELFALPADAKLEKNPF